MYIGTDLCSKRMTFTPKMKGSEGSSLSRLSYDTNSDGDTYSMMEYTMVQKYGISKSDWILTENNEDRDKSFDHALKLLFFMQKIFFIFKTNGKNIIEI